MTRNLISCHDTDTLEELMSVMTERSAPRASLSLSRCCTPVGAGLDALTHEVADQEVRATIPNNVRLNSAPAPLHNP
jgi:hypothetical protein